MTDADASTQLQWSHEHPIVLCGSMFKSAENDKKKISERFERELESFSHTPQLTGVTEQWLKIHGRDVSEQHTFDDLDARAKCNI